MGVVVRRYIDILIIITSKHYSIGARGSDRTRYMHCSKSLTFFPFGRHRVTSDLSSAGLTFAHSAFTGGGTCGTKWTAHGYKYTREMHQPTRL